MKTKIDSGDWIADRGALLEALREFAEIMKRRPFDNQGGLRGVSAFALFWFVRQCNPSVVFEVGVWRGFSTWLIEQAAPEAELHCFDPIFFMNRYLNRRRVGPTYRPRRANYWTQDFSCAPIAEIAMSHDRPLAFFDDHQNKWPRVRQCRAAGISEIVFDDNAPTSDTHRTLEADRRAGRIDLSQELESYSIFPALWPVDFRYGSAHILESGLDLPVEPGLAVLYEERQWHSYVTHVRLHGISRDPATAAPEEFNWRDAEGLMKHSPDEAVLDRVARRVRRLFA